MKAFAWIKNIIILILSILFLALGVNTLFCSYRINNPMEFVMYFFSSSLLILVCLVGIIYFFSRLLTSRKEELTKDETH